MSEKSRIAVPGVCSAADQSKGQMRSSAQFAHCRSNIFVLGQTQETDGKIAQAGHQKRAGPGANLRTVFVEGHVPYPMVSVFNLPMAPIQLQQALRLRLGGRETGNQISGFLLGFPGLQIFGEAFDDGDLPAVREIDIVVEFGAGPDLPGFQPAVAFIGGFVLRGEKPRSSRGRRYLVSGWVGCL